VDLKVYPAEGFSQRRKRGLVSLKGQPENVLAELLLRLIFTYRPEYFGYKNASLTRRSGKI
jgi:hypothetical protein